MKHPLVFVIYFLCVKSLFAQLRSFNEIFPDVNEEVRTAVFSSKTYVKSGQKSGGFTLLGNGRNTALNPQILNIVLSKNPRWLVESMFVIPGLPGTVDLLDIYNALGNIREINNPQYRNQEMPDSPVFENATRIVSEKQTTAIPDPTPSRTIPNREVIYIKLKDKNFGNTYYRSQITKIQNGLSYTMTNFKNISFLFIPVIRGENFFAQLYIEPINEGILFYIIAGADIADFITSRIDINSAINKRLSVFTSWAVGGIIEKRLR